MTIDINNLTTEQQTQLFADLQAKAKEVEQSQLDALQDLFETVYDAALVFKTAVETKFPDITTNSNNNPDLYKQYAGAVNIVVNEKNRRDALNLANDIIPEE